MLQKSREATILMLLIFALAFTVVSLLLDLAFGAIAFQGPLTFWAFLLLIALVVVTFYQWLAPPDRTRYGVVGALGWGFAGGLYALVLRAIIILIQDKFLRAFLALVSFWLVHNLVFRLLALGQKRKRYEKG